MRQVMLALAVLSALTGCGKKYPKPYVEPAAMPFKGIASYFLEPQQKDVYALIVHGMCTHTEESWVNAVWAPSIRKQLAATELSPGTLALSGANGVRTVDRTFDVKGQRTLHVRFVLWSALTTDGKKSLAYDQNVGDGDGEFPLERAKVNKSVKANLINDCFSDAIAYSGTRSQEIRDAVRDKLCDNFEGCAAGQTLLIVTESLGSKIVIDAVASMAATPRQQVLAATRQIFMMANQLPLLRLAAGPNSPPPLLSSFLSQWRSSRGASGSDVSVVAFTDPNDLLSYRLKPSDFPTIRLHNVLISNDKTMLGYLENPATAHTGYRTNAEVMRQVLCGYRTDSCETLKREKPAPRP